MNAGGILKNRYVQVGFILLGAVIGGVVLGGLVAERLMLQDTSLFGQIIEWKGVFTNVLIGLLAYGVGRWWQK